MAKWTTAAGISRRFLVGVERLLDYSRRGNLPMRTDPDGTLLFDEDIVVHLFRLRRASLEVPNGNLGVLGQSFLNAPAQAPAQTTVVPRRSEPVPKRGREPAQVVHLRTGTGPNR